MTDDQVSGRRPSAGLPDDEARRIILSRRARFIAAALASAGLTAATSCNKSSVESNPQPCLSVAPQNYDAAPPPPFEAPPEPVPPQVCLSPLPAPPEDAGIPPPPSSAKIPS